MELVYLWVEDYKNIKQQGFNFSPRFDCEFKDGELNITDKEETREPYLKNFFGDNINITAIVGENGSGKSSILSNIPFKARIKTIIVFLIEKKIKIYSKITNIQSSYEINSKFDNCNFEYFSLNYDFLTASFINNVYSYAYEPLKFHNHLLADIYVNSNSFIDLYKYKCIINELIYKYSNKKSLFNYNPAQIKFTKYTGNIEGKLVSLKLELEKIPLVDPDFDDSGTNIYDFLLYEFKDSEKFEEQFLVYIFLLVYSKDKKVVQIIEDLYFEHDMTILDVKGKFFNYIKDNDSLKDLNVLTDNFDSYVKIFNKEKLFENKRNITKLKNKYNKCLDILFDYNIQKILNIDFYDDDNIEFKELSQGERQIYSNILLIYNKIQNLSKNVLVLLDEPDLSLHPEWQKKYVSQLINTFSKVNKKIHFLVTSHSPFILSDIPKENVIFLKKDKNGNCKNVTKETNLETFGANIHTLLSHGFFMKDGLMGEFAKEKIDLAITYLNKKKLSIEEIDYCENIIPIIGEPIIKKQLQRMLDSKRLSKIDNIDVLEAELELIKHRIELIRKTNDTN